MDQPNDPTDRSLRANGAVRSNSPIGGSIVMVVALISVFASGIGYDLFGRPIIFDSPGLYVFFGSIWMCLFGMVWAFASAWTAFRTTVVIAAFYLALYVAGKLSRGEL